MLQNESKRLKFTSLQNLTYINYKFSFRVFLLLENGTSLKIYNVTRSDAGVYTCIATNQFGVAKNTGSLIIRYFTIFVCAWWYWSSCMLTSITVNPESYCICEIFGFWLIWVVALYLLIAWSLLPVEQHCRCE